MTLLRTTPISTWACVRLNIETAWRFFFSVFFLLFLLGFRRRTCKWDTHKTYIWSWITAANLQNTHLSYIKRLSYINNAPASKEVELYQPQHAADKQHYWLVSHSIKQKLCFTVKSISVRYQSKVWGWWDVFIWMFSNKSLMLNKAAFNWLCDFFIIFYKCYF